MKGFFKSAAISILGPLAIGAGLLFTANLSSNLASSSLVTPASVLAYIPGVPTDTTRPPIPNPPWDGNGDSGFVSIPGVFVVFEPTEKDTVRPEFKAAENKEFYWIGFDDFELGSKKAQKDKNGKILVERYGKLTPAYEFDRADGTYVSSITKTALNRKELIAVLSQLRSRLESEHNNFEHIDKASEVKPAEISDSVGVALQEDMLREFGRQVAASKFTLTVLCEKSKQSKSIEKTAKKAARTIRSDRPAVLFVNTHDWLNQRVLNSLEVKGPTEEVTYLVVDRQQKIVGRRDAPAASIDDLVDFINESIAGAEAQ